jgi:hypothetical protein
MGRTRLTGKACPYRYLLCSARPRRRDQDLEGDEASITYRDFEKRGVGMELSKTRLWNWRAGSKALVCATLWVGLLGATKPGLAETVVVPCTLGLDKPGLLSIQTSGLAADGTTVTIQENEEIVFAELSYHDDLPPGTRIELWPMVEGEPPAWEMEDPPFDRNLWVTDERTETLVRFDVTPIVRAWEQGDLPNLGLVTRIVETAGVESAAGAAFNAPKEAILVYHIVSLRAKKDIPSGPERGGKGKVPGRASTGDE